MSSVLIHLNVSIVEVQQGDMKVPITKPDINKANPKIGVGLVAFSCDETKVLCRHVVPLIILILLLLNVVCLVEKLLTL
jgi:hypothetical protein